jgi:competence protein ComGC
MSSEETVRPYHATPDARGQETADAVAAVIKHAHDRDEAARKRERPRGQPRWMLPLGINLAVFAVYLLIAPPAWVTVNPIEGPDPAAQEQSLRVAMFLQAQQIEAYRLEHGALPASLAELERDPVSDEVEYVPRGSSYQLVGAVGESALVYDSTGDNAEFTRSMSARMAGAGS